MNPFDPAYIPQIKPDTTSAKKARAATKSLENRRDGHCGQLRARTEDEKGRDRAKRMASI